MTPKTTADALLRDPLAKAMLAAWLNVKVEQLPPMMNAHTCDTTMVAWKRVGEAARAFRTPGKDHAAEGEHYPSLELCVQFSDDGQHIRKWSRLPFEGGERLYSHPAAPETAAEREAKGDADTNERAALSSPHEAAIRLVAKLDAVHADPAYQSVWEQAQMRFGPYKGLTYVDELDAVRRALGPTPVMQSRETMMKEVVRIIGIYQHGCGNTQRMQGDKFVPGDPTECEECNELVIGLLRKALSTAPAPSLGSGQRGELP